MTEELNCPFCGKVATITYDGGNEVYNQSWRVACGACGVGFKESGSNSWVSDKAEDEKAQARAIERWNRRAAPASEPAEVDTAEFQKLELAYVKGIFDCEDGLSAKTGKAAGDARAAMIAHIAEFGAQQREAGRREKHETNVALVAEITAMSKRLNTMRSAFHQNMMRAFPDKSHAEIAAEIAKVTGISEPVSALTDEQREVLKDVTDVLDTFGNLPDGMMAPYPWNEHKAEEKIAAARALLAASPAKVSDDGRDAEGAHP